MAVNNLMAAKIRMYIKRLGRRYNKYTMNEAFERISKQIQQDEALKKGEMKYINEDIMSRLKDNWPFKNKI